MGVWNWELAFFDLGMWNEMRRYVEALLLFFSSFLLRFKALMCYSLIMIVSNGQNVANETKIHSTDEFFFPLAKRKMT